MKHLLFILSFLMPSFVFINGSLFIGYLIYLTFVNPLPTNIVGCLVLSATFGYCFYLFVSDYNQKQKETKF